MGGGGDREGMSRGKTGRDEGERERGGYRVQGRKNLMGAL